RQVRGCRRPHGRAARTNLHAQCARGLSAARQAARRLSLRARGARSVLVEQKLFAAYESDRRLELSPGVPPDSPPELEDLWTRRFRDAHSLVQPFPPPLSQEEWRGARPSLPS